MDGRSGDFTELKNELESSLADISVACTQHAGTELLDNLQEMGTVSAGREIAQHSLHSQ